MPLSFEEGFPENSNRDEFDKPQVDFEDQQENVPPDIHADQIVEEDIAAGAVADYVSLLGSVDYKVAVKAAMSLMLDNDMNEGDSEVTGQCELCLDDETILISTPLVEKYKVWKDPYHLSRHMRSQIHSPFEIFKRRATKLALEEKLQGLACEFCGPIRPKNRELHYFSHLNALARHATRSNHRSITLTGGWSTPNLAEKHEAAKREYGWFDNGFNGDTEQKARQKASREHLERREQGLQNPSFAFSDDKELPGPVPLVKVPGTALGSSHDMDNVMSGYRGLLKHCPAPLRLATSSGISSRLSTRVHISDSVSSDTQTPAFRQLLAQFEASGKLSGVPFPGTSENMPEDGHRIRDKGM